MKRLLYFALTLLFPALFLTQTNFEGKIGDNEIEIFLKVDGTFVDGIYMYSKWNEPIYIKGEIEKDHLKLYELKEGNKIAEFYFDDFKKGKDQYFGTWTNLKTKNKLDFVVKKKIEQNSILQFNSSKRFYFKSKIENNKNYLLIVEKNNNKIFQKLQMNCAIEDVFDVSVGDYNFDGYEDFSACLQSYAGPNTSRTYFLFDKKNNVFFESDFNGISLEFDSKKKLITETNQCCAGATVLKKIYNVRHNKMILIKEHCYKWDEKIKDLVHRNLKECQ